MPLYRPRHSSDSWSPTRDNPPNTEAGWLKLVAPSAAVAVKFVPADTTALLLRLIPYLLVPATDQSPL